MTLGVGSAHRVLVWRCRAIALGLGLLQAWAFRYEATPDGVSYLDVADAYREGRWSDAPNGYWSPLYPGMLAIVGRVLPLPPPDDFVLAHVVNLIAYIASLCTFEFLLRGIAAPTTDLEDRQARGRDWWIVGYALFLWATLGLIGLGVTTPDMLLASAAFAVAGVLTRIRLPGPQLKRGAALGLAAGVGYLAKAAFLPISAVVLLVATVLWWRTSRSVRPALVAVACFALVASPHVISLSRAKGRVTFGDSGPLAYAWIVNAVPGQVHWQGGPPSAGKPVHPTRQVSTLPATYEFGTPLRATYPPWYDPTYWYDGVKARWAPLTQLRIAFHNLPALSELFVPLILIAVATLVAVGLRPRPEWSVLRDGWPLIVPGIAAIALYASLFLETRYIAPFAVMVWLGTLIVLERWMPPSWQAGLFAGAAVVLAMTMLPNLAPKLRALLPTYHNSHWEDAEFVLAAGLHPGDRIAIVGNGVFAYWARLARLRIVAEVPSNATGAIWQSSDAQRAALLTTLQRAGASAVVADHAPSDWPGWRVGRDGRLAVLRLSAEPRE